MLCGMTIFALLVIAAAALTLACAMATKDRRQRSHALYAVATLTGILAVLNVLRGFWGLLGLTIVTMIALIWWADDEAQKADGQ